MIYPRQKTVCFMGTALTENNSFLVSKYTPLSFSIVIGLTDCSRDFLLNEGIISCNKNDLLAVIEVPKNDLNPKGANRFVASFLIPISFIPSPGSP